ncbi:MAG: hypothetical protein IJF80_02590 [Clostridia bacterium]|nr:hypothetical protein [Clostridia bacterium]
MFEAKWYMGQEAVETLEKLNIKTNANDVYAVHVFVTEKDGGAMIAVGSACPDLKSGGDVQIERIVLMEKYKNTIFDELVLRMLLFKFQELKNKKISMWANEKQASLLARFGFSSTGEKNTASDEMLFKMSADTDKILWPSDCKC